MNPWNIAHSSVYVCLFFSKHISHCFDLGFFLFGDGFICVYFVCTLLILVLTTKTLFCDFSNKKRQNSTLVIEFFVQFQVYCGLIVLLLTFWHFLSRVATANQFSLTCQRGLADIFTPDFLPYTTIYFNQAGNQHREIQTWAPLWLLVGGSVKILAQRPRLDKVNRAPLKSNPGIPCARPTRNRMSHPAALWIFSLILWKDISAKKKRKKCFFF